MAVIKLKPTSAGRRGQVKVTRNFGQGNLPLRTTHVLDARNLQNRRL